MSDYLFCSERLGFRAWKQNDLPLIEELNSIPEVMRYFPSIPTTEQNKALLDRMMTLFDTKGYCYFPVEEINSSRFVGFIGMADQDYPSPFTPGVDIGWRLHPDFWGKGLATEGARSILDYGFKEIGLKRIFSIAPSDNKASISVMQKIEMDHLMEFEHPNLKDHPELCLCQVYQIDRSD